MKGEELCHFGESLRSNIQSLYSVINMLKKLVTMTLILSIVATGCIDEMTVEEIAKHTQEKYETVHDFKATMIATTNVQGAEVTDEIEISIKKPNKFRSEDKK